MANLIVLFSIAILVQFASGVPVTRKNLKRRASRHSPVTQCDNDCQDNVTVPKSLTLKEQFLNSNQEEARNDEQIPFREEELLRVEPRRMMIAVPVLEDTIQRPGVLFRSPRMAFPTVLSYLPVADVTLYRTFIHGFDSLKDSINLEDPSSQNLVKRDATDDFMEQLAHDAIMPNILPTMQIPEVRSANYDENQGGVKVVYPGSSSKCALPLLFGCSPRVVVGALARRVSSHEPSPVPGY